MAAKKSLGKVKAKWHPPAGFFKRSARQIALGLIEHSATLKQADNRLTFYTNRAGRNLSAQDRRKLAEAKKLLQQGARKAASAKPKAKPRPKSRRAPKHPSWHIYYVRAIFKPGVGRGEWSPNVARSIAPSAEGALKNFHRRMLALVASMAKKRHRLGVKVLKIARVGSATDFKPGSRR